MSAEGFIKDLLTGTNSFYKIGLTQLSWYKKTLGTKCIVSRIIKQSKYKDVFGSTVSSTINENTDVEEFPYVVLINLNDMMKLFQKSITQLDFYDNESILQLGDVLRFSSSGQEFRYKITDIQTFNETGKVLNRYSISGLVEVSSNK